MGSLRSIHRESQEDKKWERIHQFVAETEAERIKVLMFREMLEKLISRITKTR